MVIDYPEISRMAGDIQQTAVTHAVSDLSFSGLSVDLNTAELPESVLKRYAFTHRVLSRF